MTTAAPQADHNTKVKETLLSCLILAYLFFTITWLSPESNLRTRILEPVKQFWLFWGFEDRKSVV